MNNDVVLNPRNYFGRLIKLILLWLILFSFAFSQQNNNPDPNNPNPNNPNPNNPDPNNPNPNNPNPNNPNPNNPNPNNPNPNNPNPNDLKIKSGGLSKLVTEVVSDFERDGSWYAKMFTDHGLVQIKRRRGYASDGSFDLRSELGVDKSSYTLGVKVMFRRIYFSQAEIIPPSDIRLYGNVEKLTVWAFGKNIGHKLSAIVEDSRGKLYQAPFNKGGENTLKFGGWQKLEAVIPDDSRFYLRKDQFKKRVVQKNNKLNSYYHPEGIKFKKFVIDFDANHADGVYYLYLDQFEYVSDIYEYEMLRELMSLPETEISDPLENW